MEEKGIVLPGERGTNEDDLFGGIVSRWIPFSKPPRNRFIAARTCAKFIAANEKLNLHKRP